MQLTHKKNETQKEMNSKTKKRKKKAHFVVCVQRCATFMINKTTRQNVEL